MVVRGSKIRLNKAERDCLSRMAGCAADPKTLDDYYYFLRLITTDEIEYYVDGPNGAILLTKLAIEELSSPFALAGVRMEDIITAQDFKNAHEAARPYILESLAERETDPKIKTGLNRILKNMRFTK